MVSSEAVLHLFRLAANACGTNTGIFPSLYDDLKCVSGPNGQGPELTSLNDILIIVGNVLKILMMLAGSLAVIVIIVAAIYYITSTGDPARIKRAKDILLNTSIGLLATIIAYAGVTFIAQRF